METTNIVVDRQIRLGLRGRSVFAFAALALALPFSSWYAHAGEPETLASSSVSFDRVALSSSDGVERIYGDLRAAGHEVCALYDRRSPTTARAHEICVDAAVGNAVAQIGAPLLTARHQAKGRPLFDSLRALVANR